MDSFILNLREALQKPLPGRPAQVLMAPAHRETYYEVPEDHKIACVLALLIPKNGEWHLVFIERNRQANDKHSGQISFPGGKMNDSDPNYEYCALRETEEEIGVPMKNIEVLGELSDLYLYVSNFRIFPFVGYCDHYPNFSKQESEVSAIIEVPVSLFISGQYQSKKDISVRNYILKDVPFYDLNGATLWGATAMMMSELNSILSTLDLSDRLGLLH